MICILFDLLPAFVPRSASHVAPMLLLPQDSNILRAVQDEDD